MSIATRQDGNKGAPSRDRRATHDSCVGPAGADPGAEYARLTHELRISEERLEFALESTGEGVWDWNIAADTVFYSARFRAILGLPDDARDDTGYWWSRIHPGDVADPAKFAHYLLGLERRLFVCEHRLRHADGHWVWVETRGNIVARDADGKPQRMVGTITDITATRLLREELETSHQLLAKLTSQVPGALFEFVMQPDGQLVCTYISAMSEEMFEHTPKEIEDDINCLNSRIYQPDRARLRQSLRLAADSMQAWQIDYRVMLPRKGLCWRELCARPTRNGDGAITWHGFTTDISDRKRNEHTIRQFNEKLERRAHYDALTGLPNRVLFRDRLEQEMKHAQGAAHAMALLFIDLDRFKEVNDLLGHDAGDQLLTGAARRIERCLRPGDTVARLAGDEFTVILADMAETSHIEQTAQAILDVLRQPFQLGIEQAYVSASIGVAVYPGDGSEPEELMRHADHAMYRSKGRGRNQLTFFEAGMQEAAMRRLTLSSELRRAQEAKQLELHFQPIVDGASGAVCKAEALLRWRRPNGTLALPADFVWIAEETGLIHEIGNWVFREAARWSQRWSGMLGKPFQVSINKSPVQFQPHARSMNWISYLDQCDMPHNSIAVEITEGVLLNLTDDVHERLDELQRAGMEVSIDDFGTGYSSMNYLKRLDIDYLKIDRSFVSEMLHDHTSRTITETIIVMAHKLGLKVIAEGVESAEQRDWLAAQHCDYLQGFLFGPAVPPEDFEQLLAGKPLLDAPPHRLQSPS
ncbi:putative bifunctional diguanylate cyclase/phosphodiesterase [Massilia soli]|uniref:EAL domain-containing protein n=1 Tax=Massilia soli TaxID=2792854 RepID=A0ABS7SHY7_9BURK|nr:GGDEF domain-containing phosphodiesterase [Massilia soli]MBZ2205724.1 EAL domain-containing protein [Massilia soli]